MRRTEPRPVIQTPVNGPVKTGSKRAVAPPAYRPQPIPKVLQTKRAAGNPNHEPPRIISTRPISAPHVSHQRPQPAVSQPGANIVQSKPLESRIRQVLPAFVHPVRHQTAVQRFKPEVVQAKATKFYPNLHPGAAVPVERSNIFSLDSFANQYRLHRVGTHSVNVPNMKYNFVRTREGQTLLHNRYRHPSLAEGQQVLYAGEVFFNNGNLEWWSNGSGHYQPDAGGAEQANLPMDYFYSYQQVIKGEHTRRRG
jgi:hypothetical protein